MTIADVLAQRITDLAVWSDRRGRVERLSELGETVNALRKAGLVSDTDFDRLMRLAFTSANA